MPAKKTTILTLARSGGVAGIRPPSKTLDTAKLPAAAAQRIEELLNTASFFKLPAVLPVSAPGADTFQHSLTVSHASGCEHTVTFTEASASEALRELKRMVRDLA
ncbi:MAG: hypothetical protein IPP19_08505 [Verrucomicrobia bacterium]|nr:hypothetical protein [Verrucomicrobiota bacterium]